MSPGIPYRGPHVILTREEAEYLNGLLKQTTNPIGKSIHSKCYHALNTNPAFLQPHKS